MLCIVGLHVGVFESVSFNLSLIVVSTGLYVSLDDLDFSIRLQKTFSIS